jgi:hypothetical protein
MFLVGIWNYEMESSLPQYKSANENRSQFADGSSHFRYLSLSVLPGPKEASIRKLDNNLPRIHTANSYFFYFHYF